MYFWATRKSNFSTNSRLWKILNDGKYIAYKNLNDDDYKPENIFDLKYCIATEGSGEGVFELSTQNRTFTLKAPSNEERVEWIKGITYLKK